MEKKEEQVKLSQNSMNVVKHLEGLIAEIKKGDKDYILVHSSVALPANISERRFTLLSKTITKPSFKKGDFVVVNNKTILHMMDDYVEGRDINLVDGGTISVKNIREANASEIEQFESDLKNKGMILKDGKWDYLRLGEVAYKVKNLGELISMYKLIYDLGYSLNIGSDLNPSDNFLTFHNNALINRCSYGGRTLVSKDVFELMLKRYSKSFK